MKIFCFGEKKNGVYGWVGVSRGEWLECEGLDLVSCVFLISYLDLYFCFCFNFVVMVSYNVGKFVFYELFFF